MMSEHTGGTNGEVDVRFLNRPGGRVAYDVQGEGPLVVCLPGMGELRSAYRFTAPVLVDAGYRVATLDLRGHGDSDATFDSYDDVAAGTDALALVDELGGDCAVLVGNSMSAGAAVWAAAERPEAVSGLVLIGPFVRNVPMNPLLAAVFRVATSGPWARRVWTSYLSNLSPGRRPADFEEHRAAIAASLTVPGHARAFTATTRTSHAPAEARLDDVRTRTLVVMGELDPDFPDPNAEAQHVADRLGATVLMVPEAGHYPQAERPDVVGPALVDFLTAA
jgi:pimeloyl-ACP methyl ester carboxylesterase